MNEERIREEALLDQDEIIEAVANVYPPPEPATDEQWQIYTDAVREAIAQAQLDQVFNTEVYKGYTIKDLIERGVMPVEEQSLPAGCHATEFSNGRYIETQVGAMLRLDSEGRKFIKVESR